MNTQDQNDTENEFAVSGGIAPQDAQAVQAEQNHSPTESVEQTESTETPQRVVAMAQESEPSVEEFSLPPGLKESFELLTQIDNLPENTRQEKAIKLKKLSLIRPHVFNLQQGLLKVSLTANDMVPQCPIARHEERLNQIRDLAASNPDVAALLEERGEHWS